MPLYMDVHRNLEGVSPEALREAHLQDLKRQEEFKVKYHRYFFNEETGTVFCLAEGPDAEACQAVHEASHGLLADEIIEVQPELVEAFFATARYDDVGAAVTRDGRPDGALRIIMFTQIANFTALSRDDDEAAARLLECHDLEVREVLPRHGGTEVRHTGEGIMACFTSVSGALGAAMEIQRRCAAHAHPKGPEATEGGEGGEHPRVRIGMSAGEPVSHHEDLFGAVVNTARRICEAARPGQILVSGALRELGAGKAYRFLNAGQRMLKDVDERLVLYAVDWGGEEERDSDHLPSLRGFWDELGRRRVVRVGVAYSVALFVVLQVAELTLEPLGLPAWSYTLVLVLGLLGLLPALVLAWAFDITPSGVKRTPPPPVEDPRSAVAGSGSDAPEDSSGPVTRSGGSLVES